jgi:hypothetical protein
VKTLRQLPEKILVPVVQDDSLHPQLLDLLSRARMSDVELMAAVIMHPATSLKTLLNLAEKSLHGVLERLAGYQKLLHQYPQLVEAIIANPAAEKTLKFNLGWQDPDQDQDLRKEDTAADDEDDEDDEGDEDRSQTEIEALMESADEDGLSKYQIALELKVAEKIKIGMTGDKEWRGILMKESNKLVQGAVMNNPRISDGEVLLVAKNKTSSDDLIRLILLNKDWMKNYEIKKALVAHPKTPVPKALRYVSFLTMKDLKELARSRQISNVVMSSARKELEKRIKKQGG